MDYKRRTTLGLPIPETSSHIWKDGISLSGMDIIRPDQVSRKKLKTTQHYSMLKVNSLQGK